MAGFLLPPLPIFSPPTPYICRCPAEEKTPPPARGHAPLSFPAALPPALPQPATTEKQPAVPLFFIPRAPPDVCKARLAPGAGVFLFWFARGSGAEPGERKRPQEEKLKTELPFPRLSQAKYAPTAPPIFCGGRVFWGGLFLSRGSRRGAPVLTRAPASRFPR